MFILSICKMENYSINNFHETLGFEQIRQLVYHQVLKNSWGFDKRRTVYRDFLYSSKFHIDEKYLSKTGYKQAVSYIKFSDDCKLLSIGYATGGIRVYDIDRYEYIAEIEIPKIREVSDFDFDPTSVHFPITCFRWMSNSQVFASSGDGTIKLWNVKETDPKKRLKNTFVNLDCAFNAMDIDFDKSTLITGGMDHCLRVYDLNEMKERDVYQGEDKEHFEHFNRIFSVKIDSINRNIFYSCGWDKMVITHDIREKHSVSSFMGPYVAGDTLDAQGNYLLAGSYRSHDPLEIYDTRTGERVKSYEWTGDEENKGGMVLSCEYSRPNYDTIIAGSSSEHEVKLFRKILQFNRKDGAIYSTITGFSGPIAALNMDCKGNKLAIGTSTGGVVLLNYGITPEEKPEESQEKTPLAESEVKKRESS